MATSNLAVFQAPGLTDNAALTMQLMQACEVVDTSESTPCEMILLATMKANMKEQVEHDKTIQTFKANIAAYKREMEASGNEKAILRATILDLESRAREQEKIHAAQVRALEELNKAQAATIAEQKKEITEQKKNIVEKDSQVKDLTAQIAKMNYRRSRQAFLDSGH